MWRELVKQSAKYHFIFTPKMRAGIDKKAEYNEPLLISYLTKIRKKGIDAYTPREPGKAKHMDIHIQAKTALEASRISKLISPDFPVSKSFKGGTKLHHAWKNGKKTAVIGITVSNKKEPRRNLLIKKASKKIRRNKIPKYMYHGSPKKLKHLAPGKRGLFLTPHPGIASIFTIPKEDIKELQKYRSYNTGYKEWKSSDHKLKEPLRNIHIEHTARGEAPSSGTSIGYVYKVDVSKHRHLLEHFLDNPNQDRELVYKGPNLKFDSRTKHKTNWKAKFSSSQVKRHKDAVLRKKAAAKDSFLKKLYDEDQADRKRFREDPSGSYESFIKNVTYKDKIRTLKVMRSLKNKMPKGKDAEYAAMILHHAPGTPLSRKRHVEAHELAAKVIERADKTRSTDWLKKAIEDRNLMMYGKPQIHGTQFPWEKKR